MKLFIVNAEEWEYDFVSSVVVLAKSEDEAIDLSIKYDSFFENNIGEVKEVSIYDEGVIHDHIMYG